MLKSTFRPGMSIKVALLSSFTFILKIATNFVTLKLIKRNYIIKATYLPQKIQLPPIKPDASMFGRCLLVMYNPNSKSKCYDLQILEHRKYVLKLRYLPFCENYQLGNNFVGVMYQNLGQKKVGKLSGMKNKYCFTFNQVDRQQVSDIFVQKNSVLKRQSLLKSSIIWNLEKKIFYLH